MIAEVAQVARGEAALFAAEGGAAVAHLARGGARRAADPLHLAALLVDHDQQRVAQRRRARDRLQAGDQRAPGGAAGEVAGEEDDAGELALADRPPQPRRDPGAVEPGDDPLARQLAAAAASSRLSLDRRLGAAPSPSAAPSAKAPSAERRPAPPARARRRAAIRRPLHGAMLRPSLGPATDDPLSGWLPSLAGT